MKYKPNSNLLTIADSPTQQHLVSLVIYLYIHRYIQMLLDSPPAPSSRLRSYVAMVLGASTTKEILLDYNPVRSDRFVSTLCKTDVATWRHKVSHVAEGRGNVLAGGERGKSHITYRPYGEILRTDSYGPDISKFKYTGQEEDRESGLMYYKARYYDAKIGRFLQQDSMAFPNQVQGMNRMMYVEGNPLRHRDQSGNALSNSWMYAIGTYMIAKNQGLSDQQAMVWAAAAYGVGRAKDKNQGDFWKNNDISRGITSTWKSYLKTDFGKISTKIYDFARKSDIGVSITKNWQGTVKWARSLSTETIIVIIANVAVILIGIFVFPSFYLVIGGVYGLASTFGGDTDFPDGGDGSTKNESTYDK